MNRRILITLIVVLIVCICLVCVSTGAFVINAPTISQLIDRVGAPSPFPIVTSSALRSATSIPGATSAPGLSATPLASPSRAPSLSVSPLPSPSRVSTLAATPLPAVSLSTVDALARTLIPRRDVYQVAARLRKNPVLQTPVPTPAPRTWKVGDKDTFFVVQDASIGSYRTVTATLQIVTPTAYFWVEDGLKVDATALRQSADFWEQKAYPTDLEYFGAPARGWDGELRIHILNTFFENAAGYFSGEDSYPRQLFQYSNQRNIIYMNARDVPPGRDEYNGDLAHEFQHLIHDSQAQYKTGWLDEGMSELAIRQNGFRVLGSSDAFARNPDTQLNTWSDSPQANYAHYDAAYLFANYTAQRFGPEFIRAVIHMPAEGINGFQAVLDQRASGMKFDDLFSDWAVTNILNDPSVENGRYAYASEPNFRITRVSALNQFPVERSAQVQEYTGSYYTLQPTQPSVTLIFTGTTTAKLLPVEAYSGKWMWYSNRADVSDMTLTRQVDLTRTTGKATLNYWTWFDIEKNYDYGYVEVSIDNGKTWDILPGKNTTTENPNGANYGTALTGASGVTDNKATPAWVQEQVDLTTYAGKTILLRFEYITDDAVNLRGWAIDDVTIPEINYTDNMENLDAGWQAAGFIRTDNVLPQKYSVRVIEQGTTTSVVTVPLDAQNRGMLKIDGFGTNISKATLVISAFAPTTTEPTNYQFSVVPR